jgi:hypothetical protein
MTLKRMHPDSSADEERPANGQKAKRLMPGGGAFT